MHEEGKLVRAKNQRTQWEFREEDQLGWGVEGRAEKSRNSSGKRAIAPIETVRRKGKMGRWKWQAKSVSRDDAKIRSNHSLFCDLPLTKPIKHPSLDHWKMEKNSRMPLLQLPSLCNQLSHYSPIGHERLAQRSTLHIKQSNLDLPQEHLRYYRSPHSGHKLAQAKDTNIEQSRDLDPARPQILEHSLTSHSFRKDSYHPVDRLHWTCSYSHHKGRLLKARSKKSHANRR